MTPQTHQTDDGQLMQDHDQPVLESHLTEPEAGPTAAEPDLAEPAADLTVTHPAAGFAPADAAEQEAQLAEPDHDQTQNEDSAILPVSASAPEDGASATSPASGNPGLVADSAGAQEMPMADGSSGNPEPVSAGIMAPEPVGKSQHAADAASEAGPWSEIQAMFVDDPRASVERAAGLVDDRVQEYIASVKKRQRSVQSALQTEDAGTEELRVALQHCRTFWNSLEDLPDQSLAPR
jgi:hypothetical protein